MSSIYKLPDGRNLNYAEYGDRQGLPVLFCHGTPGARYQVTESMARHAKDLGMRLIVPERPGYGLSDPQPGRSFLDWTKDAAALLNALDIDSFWPLGYSIGGVYAWACAAALPERAIGASLVGCLAHEVFEEEVVAHLSPALNAIFAMARDNPAGLGTALAAMLPDAGTLFAALADGLPEADLECLTDPQVASAFRQDCTETLRQGHNAMTADYVLLVNDWGFIDLTIRTPIQVWSGTEDRVASPAMVKRIRDHLPVGEFHTIPGAGHLCMFSHWPEILAGIASATHALKA